MAFNYNVGVTNSVLVLGAGDLLPNQPIIGWSPDDFFSTAEVSNNITQMTLDGFLTYGWVPVEMGFDVMLYAASPSNAFFDTIWNNQNLTQSSIRIDGNCTTPLGIHYTLTNGVMKSYTPIPAAKKTFQSRSFKLVFQSIVGFPVA